MNKENPFREQAEKNRKRIARVRPETKETATLPPRSRIHQNKKKKTVLKLKYPVIRLLVLFFVLLPITVFSVISTIGENNSKSSSVGGYDEVSLEKQGAEHDRIMDDQDENIEKDAPIYKTAEEEKQDSEEQASPPSGETHSEGKDVSQQTKTPPTLNTNTDSSPPKEVEKKEEVKKEEVKKEEEKKPETAGTVGNPIYHTVKPGETLFRIAMMYFKTQEGIEKIRTANGIQGNEIETGQTLIIPVN